MKREKSLWILVIIALLFLVFWNLRSHAAPVGSDLEPSHCEGTHKGCPYHEAEP